jgi:hypothetical protein
MAIVDTTETVCVTLLSSREAGDFVQTATLTCPALSHCRSSAATTPCRNGIGSRSGVTARRFLPKQSPSREGDCFARKVHGLAMTAWAERLQFFFASLRAFSMPSASFCQGLRLRVMLFWVLSRLQSAPAFITIPVSRARSTPCFPPLRPRSLVCRPSACSAP